MMMMEDHISLNPQCVACRHLICGYESGYAVPYCTCQDRKAEIEDGVEVCLSREAAGAERGFDNVCGDCDDSYDTRLKRDDRLSDERGLAER